MNFSIFLAHGTLGSWDEVALFGVGLTIAAYLGILYVAEQRRQKGDSGPDSHENDGPEID